MSSRTPLFDCLNCKQSGGVIGRYFKAPPQRALRQWLRVELFYELGEQLWSGNSGHEESDVRFRLKQIREQRRTSSGG